ncbi:MAG: hypothetical protein ACQGVC_02470 [Myxococcota bacterium]
MKRRFHWLVLLALLLPGLAQAAGPRDRYGVMGRILAYDKEHQRVRVKVMETSIPSGWNTVGKKPPKDIRVGKKYTFTVQPEGSVLSRTVIKTQKGWAADKKGTQEGFDKAMASLPDDRLLGMSLARTSAKGEEPAYKLMLIHVPYTREEFEERLAEVTVEE